MQGDLFFEAGETPEHAPESQGLHKDMMLVHALLRYGSFLPHPPTLEEARHGLVLLPNIKTYQGMACAFTHYGYRTLTTDTDPNTQADAHIDVCTIFIEDLLERLNYTHETDFVRGVVIRPRAFDEVFDLARLLLTQVPFLACLVKSSFLTPTQKRYTWLSSPYLKRIIMLPKIKGERHKLCWLVWVDRKRKHATETVFVDKRMLERTRVHVRSKHTGRVGEHVEVEHHDTTTDDDTECYLYPRTRQLAVHKAFGGKGQGA